jgi:putative hemolysin
MAFRRIQPERHTPDHLFYMNILTFILLLSASAFFSGSETAFLSLGKIRTKRIESMGTSGAKKVAGLLSDPHKLLITILIGNTFVNIAASCIMAEFLYELFGEAGVIISIATMTMVLLVFGEVTPKMFALENAENVAFFSSGPLKVLEKTVGPIRHVLGGVSSFIVGGMGFKARPEPPRITEQEIRSLFSMGRKKGLVKKKEKDMVESILEFKDSDAADIMTPRIDLVALDLNRGKEDLVKEIKDSQFSRYPVYVHTIDNIVGILHSKDILLNEDGHVRDLVRKPVVVPESMRIDDLLRELQARHTHMAVVTDEYGVTAGVVTIEDILEEIVGEIRDELDNEKPKIRMVDQKTYQISGLAHIDDVNEELGLNIDTDEVDTIGGYVILCLGKIPRSGDAVSIEGFNVTVGDVSKNRITMLEFARREDTRPA